MTGCLSKTADGTYMLTNARMDPAPSSTTTTAGSSSTTAGSTTPTGSTTTAGATGTTGDRPASSPAMSWVLSGHSDLDKHLGHTIQVTGKTSWSGAMDRGRTSTTTGAGTAAAPGTTTAGAASDRPRLDVKSIKMVSSSCS